MKKIAAFITALVLFLVAITCFHFAFAKGLNTNNPKFGSWINSYKDLSYAAINENISNSTAILMGSSEFQHCRKTPYHPSWVFRKQHMDMMCVGAAYNQSLSHAITLGAVGSNLQSKKAVLILSPSWFVKDGVKPEAFSVRFSESQYMAMISNEELPYELRKRLAKRSEELLSKDPAMSDRVQRYNRLFLTKNGTFTDKAFYKVRKPFINEKERITVNLAWRLSGQKNQKAYQWESSQGKAPDWNNIYKRATKDSMKNISNKFYMSDKFYNLKIVPRLNAKHNSDTSKTYANSPEYGDLKLFLDVCKAENMDVMLVLLPVNGYWYDYTGFPKSGRQTFVDNVEKIADQYNVKACNLFTESYNQGFLLDAVHPSEKGWTRINEEIYKFVKQS